MKYLYSIYHWLWAFFGVLVYRFPSRELYVVGVTGTKGKSTTVELMSALFEAAGEKTAILSSVTRKVGDVRERNMTGNTMPGRFAIQRFLRDAADAGCAYAFIEVTSQGVTQHRHRFIDWNVAVFLNLAPEHIESHGSFEAYRAAKVSFFEYVASSLKRERLFLVNKADANAEYFRAAAQPNDMNTLIEFSADEFVRQKLGTHFDLRSERVRKELGPWILAEFNLEDEAAAVALAEARDVEWKDIAKALLNFGGVTGRFELVQTKPFVAVVDYAHTPDSLRKVYSTLRREYLMEGGKLIAVLGSAGGGRDTWKRPEMGAIAAELCDTIVLTNEDPYDEDPEEIMRAIKTGIVGAGFSPARIIEIVDRKAAIAHAISLAGKGDVVVATGKGSETSIHGRRGTKTPWSEREAFEGALGITK